MRTTRESNIWKEYFDKGDDLSTPEFLELVEAYEDVEAYLNESESPVCLTALLMTCTLILLRPDFMPYFYELAIEDIKPFHSNPEYIEELLGNLIGDPCQYDAGSTELLDLLKVFKVIPYDSKDYIGNMNARDKLNEVVDAFNMVILWENNKDIRRALTKYVGRFIPSTSKKSWKKYSDKWINGNYDFQDLVYDYTQSVELIAE